ncbi:MAG: pseudouridine-5'-phosphate glycosidase [Boseongicola sp.]|nr:pseudouridine-5'-phosphate glycosidase [Boseongicola sp.]MDE0346127.1 pseudouridine-5'-phosphate glycosidase [Boseongicola sp.]
MTLPLDIDEEIRDALEGGRPVVALESTIVSHGMPYPQSIETARSAANAVRSEGAVPATIAVLAGRLTVGVAAAELDSLARAGRSARKLSRANLASCIAAEETGATTVAATMITAHIAGIEVFATGGIGGVHRGAETSFDISADLQELSITPVAVVCAGAKAILDIPKTLEVLETLGVPVTTFGSPDFPAFWSRTSSVSSPSMSKSTRQIAREFLFRRSLGLHGGQLIANPVPAEDEIPASIMNPLIEQAVSEAREQVTGPAVTPFVLDRIFELSEGRSAKANEALMLSNARLAARIASDLADLRKKG